MRMLARLCYPLIFACCASGAGAQSCDFPGTQSEINACSYELFEKEDAKLNAAYADAMAVMKDWDASLPSKERGAVEGLKQAQRAWIAFRDAACASEAYATKGGTISPMVLSSCMARLTATRSEELLDMPNFYAY